MDLPSLHPVQSVQPLPPLALDMPSLLLTTGSAESETLGGGGTFLRPGDWLFGRGALRCSTLLGSCIALVLWAPRLRLGAMTHSLMPSRPQDMREGQPLDGRFGDEAAQWLDQQFAAAGCGWQEVEAALAGGASTVNNGSTHIGAANIAWAQEWARARGLRFMQQDVGGRVVRRLAFNLLDGHLTIAHGGRLGAQAS